MKTSFKEFYESKKEELGLKAVSVTKTINQKEAFFIIIF